VIVNAQEAAGTSGGPARSRRPRGSLSADEIVAGAMELMAQENGLGGMSMPRLAEHLGVGVTSIYWYFRSKDDLVAALTERAAAEMFDALPANDHLPWDERLAEYFRAFRRLFAENPVLADLVVMRAPLQARSPEASVRFLSLLEREIGALVAAGFSDEDAISAYTTLSVYTRGCVLSQRIYGLAEQQVTAGESPLPRVDSFPDRLPLMTRLGAHYTPSMATDERFEAGMALVIDGLRGRLRFLGRATAAAPARKAPAQKARTAKKAAPGPQASPRRRRAGGA
jgi:AcrR family transcriptional regulator